MSRNWLVNIEITISIKKTFVSLDRQYNYETKHRILMRVCHGIETDTGRLIFRIYSQYGLVSSDSGAK